MRVDQPTRNQGSRGMRRSTPRILWIAAYVCVTYFAADLLISQTIVSWKNGPQLGLLRHAHTGRMGWIFIGMGLSIAWTIIVLVTSIRRPKEHPYSHKGTLIAAIALYVSVAILFVPANIWRSLFAEKLSRSDHAAEFIVEAAAQGDLRTIRRMLARGTPVDIRTSNGTTALFGAATEGQSVVVEFLLARGANSATPNMDGKTALDAARTEGHLDTVRILENASAQRVQGPR